MHLVLSNNNVSASLRFHTLLRIAKIMIFYDSFYLMNDRQLKCLFCMPCKGLHTEIYRLVSGMHHSTLPKLRKTQFHQNFDIRKLAMIYQSFVKSEGKFSGYDVCFFYSLYFQEGIIYLWRSFVRSWKLENIYQ